MENIRFRWVLCAYLNDRYQKVWIGQEVSLKKGVNSGILQRSTLSCLLFSLYVNDIFELKKNNNTMYIGIIMYIDITNTLTRYKELNNGIQKVTSFVHKIIT